MGLTYHRKHRFRSRVVVGVGDALEVGDWRKAVETGKDVTVTNKTKGTTFECTYNLSDRQRKILAAGGMLNYTSRR